MVANSVAALSEIQDTTTSTVFDINSAVLQKLLAALNECTEWGQVCESLRFWVSSQAKRLTFLFRRFQVFILDALARYEPVDGREAEQVIERVISRLAHQNAAVILSAVKIVMKSVVLLKDVKKGLRFHAAGLAGSWSM